MSEMAEQVPSKRRASVVDDEEVIANTRGHSQQAGFEARAVFSGE